MILLLFRENDEISEQDNNTLLFWSPSARTNGEIFIFLSGNSVVLLLCRLFSGITSMTRFSTENVQMEFFNFFYFCSGTQMIKKNWAVSFIGFAEYTCSSSKNRRPESRLKLATLSDPFSTKRLIQQRRQRQHPGLRCTTVFAWKGCALVSEKCLRSDMKTKYGQVKPLARIPFFQMKRHNHNAPGWLHQEQRKKEKALHSKLLYVIAPPS